MATDSAAAQSRRPRSSRTGAITTYFATTVASTSRSRFTPLLDHTPDPVAKIILVRGLSIDQHHRPIDLHSRGCSNHHVRWMRIRERQFWRMTNEHLQPRGAYRSCHTRDAGSDQWCSEYHGADCHA